jgi:hypothetical protein
VGSAQYAAGDRAGRAARCLPAAVAVCGTIEGVVAELKRRGVVFEEVDLPGFRTRDVIAEIDGNYPSKGARGERGAWFRDSEGNVGEPVF